MLTTTTYTTATFPLPSGKELRFTGDAEEAEFVATVFKNAERYRHCKAYGYPKQGSPCSAWTFDGKKVLGATLEEALDNAIAYRVVNNRLAPAQFY